ncbi:MAG: 50S ribosomal protein L6 [Rickettsiales bacterium]
MSRIGMQPINIPQGVTVKLEDFHIIIKGPKGELQRPIDNDVLVEEKDNQIIVSKRSNNKAAAQKWGLFRSLINNMVSGVTEGYSKTLNIEGVGYKASVNNNYLTLNLGYSHEIKYEIPKSVEIKCPKPTIIELSSFDKEELGQSAAIIRSLRGPEPYKGKGIRYSDEYIIRKEGKK